MNILIKFEDTYGCKTLFEYSTSCLRKHDSIDILGGFGDSGVFTITKKVVSSYDYIILVFDLDSQVNMSLTSEELMHRLKQSILVQDTGVIKDNYKNKIILIPIFFCFETLYLYSEQLKRIIAEINTLKECQAKQIIEKYKTYYDYSILNPENMDGIANKLGCIENGIQIITGAISKHKWYPQKFHLSYAKQLLKLICKDIDISDKIFEKQEDKLFELISQEKLPIDISAIYNGIHKEAYYNKYINDILFMTDIETQLPNMVIEKTLDIIKRELDEYNKHIYNKHLKFTKEDLNANYIHKLIENKKDK